MEKRTLDIKNPGYSGMIAAKQGDVGRKIQFTLLCDGIPYQIPNTAVFSIWFSGPSGEGNYDRIDGRSAVTAAENTAEVELISQMLRVPGTGTMCLILRDGTQQIGLWNICYTVEGIPGMDSSEASDWFGAFGNVLPECLDAMKKTESASERALKSASSAKDDQKRAAISAADAADAARMAADASIMAQSHAKRAEDAALRAESAEGGKIEIDYDGAGYHNSVYRGKNLGSAVTPEQYARIKDGTFKDLYIGDYWTINGVNWRIAAFDYFLNTGDTPCTEHHVVFVPDTVLYNGAMNDNDTTGGSYANSQMYLTGLEKAKTDIKSAFPDHILNHRIYINNGVYQGKPTGGFWVNNEVSLMTEQMVYGSAILTALNLGTGDVPLLYRIEKIQLPLFAMNPMISSNSQIFWLRDTVNNGAYACVTTTGTCDAARASKNYLGVRPYFCVYGGA